MSPQRGFPRIEVVEECLTCRGRIGQRGLEHDPWSSRNAISTVSILDAEIHVADHHCQFLDNPRESSEQREDIRHEYNRHVPPVAERRIGRWDLHRLLWYNQDSSKRVTNGDRVESEEMDWVEHMESVTEKGLE